MKINIYGIIDQQTSFFIADALKMAKEDVYIDIDSPGGFLHEAWKIYDAIRYHDGNVYVNVSGDCMSAAILPLLACKIENRSANKNAEFMIHKPILDWFGILQDEDCTKIHAEIVAETARMKQTYIERTNASENELDALIKAQQIFGVELAQNLGFISKTNEYINKSIKSNKMAKEETLLRKLQNLFVKVGLLNIKEFVTADGKSTLIVETDDEIKVGNETQNDDGLFIMPDGTKITVENGKVKEIEKATTEAPESSEKEKQKEEELQNLRNTISKQSEEIANLKKQLAEFDKIKSLVNRCGGESSLNALLNVKGQEAPKINVQTKASEVGSIDWLRSL